MRNIKQDIEKTARTTTDVGRAIDGLETAGTAAGSDIQKLVQAIKGLTGQGKKQRTVKGGWLLTQACMRGNYPNFVMLRNECTKQPPSSRKKRVDGKRSYPDENHLALGVINAAGIFKVTEELEPETEALYISKVMDLLDIWEARYLVDDGQGSLKTLNDDERTKIDEEVFNDIDTAVYDPMQDRIQALWISLKSLKDKSQEFNAAMQAWAERPPSKAQQYVEERRAAREKRKNWSFWKRLKWASGFRKNLD